uniref:Tripartite motif containing 25 n=1 Tax=Equus caballus TaxID=9796 RepID=A0A5F5PPU2_HORSE
MTELFTLAEELSCSICLEPFKEPVTTPCGHNFCGACLDETWASLGAPYRCPQCRAVYQARPQLRKNTVLCAVVEQFLQVELAREALPDGCTPPASAAAPAETPAKPPAPAAEVACDHCLKEAAVKTCLVCMASFCQEHLQPHLDSPAFRDHPLQPPIGDLIRRKCPQHNRLRDFFCPEHGECICHICLVEHKSCSPAPLSQASADLENKLKHKLTVMYGQINGASRALEDVRARQQDVREATQRRMEQLSQEYMEMKALIDASEANSTRKIKEEEKRVSSKFDHIYQVLLKKKSEIQNLKEETELALNKGDEFEFLEKAAKLQGVSTKPVYVPKVELNQELIKGVCQGTLDLKNELKRYIQQSQDKKPHEPPVSGDPGEHGGVFPSKTSRPVKKVPKDDKKTKKPAPPSKISFGAPEQTMESKQSGPEAGAKTTTPQANSVSLKAKVLEAFLAKSRSELLECEYFGSGERSCWLSVSPAWLCPAPRSCLCPAWSASPLSAARLSSAMLHPCFLPSVSTCLPSPPVVGSLDSIISSLNPRLAVHSGSTPALLEPSSSFSLDELEPAAVPRISLGIPLLVLLLWFSCRPPCHSKTFPLAETSALFRCSPASSASQRRETLWEGTPSSS